MGRLALIAGHSILGAEEKEGFAPLAVESPSGTVEVHERDGVVLLQRHGLARYTTAPKVDHARNLAALQSLGVDRVLAIGSVGGLRPELGVGTFVCPDDFIALHLGLSLSDAHGGERVPGFDPDWRDRILAAWGQVAEVPIHDGGVYWQAIGPRFETPAEIRLIAAHADVIGMTVASESIIAGELGIAYAAICIVDNLANGVRGQRLAVAEFEAGKEANRAVLMETLDRLTPELQRTSAEAG